MRKRKRSSTSTWADLLREIPGYDPYAQAGDCVFDEAAAERAIGFFPACLRHIKGAKGGQPFELERWQQALIGNLFGWKQPDGLRRYRECYIEVGRKNGKTPLVAGICNYLLFCDGEKGAEIYALAADAAQAELLFVVAKEQVLREPVLRDVSEVYRRSIVIPKSASSFKVVSAEADTKHGFNTHGAAIDELHVQRNRSLVDVITTSTGARRQPLVIYVTTAGYDRESICWEKYQQACRVRDNGGDPEKPGFDRQFLPVIYETKVGEDWQDEKVWRKANPNLGVSISLDYLKRECAKAQEIPDYENTFRQLHLDQWTEQAQVWLPMEAWRSTDAIPIDEKALIGRTCFAGLDLASTRDITALALLFPDQDGRFIVVPRFWVPKDKAKKVTRATGIPYETWLRQGWLIGTEGDWCDYNKVEQDIVALNDVYPIKELAFDPKEASMLSQKLLEEGIPQVKFIQSFTNYNEPVKYFEQLVNEGKILHGGHPVLSWMAGNAALDRNIAGLRIPSKAKSGGKIDGIVATVMALGRAMLHKEPPGDQYAKRGLLTV